MKKVLTTAILLGFVAASANAVILADENFDRPDGSLVGTSPTPGPGGTWANHSGTEGDLLISSGQALVQHGAPSEDAHTPFAAQSSGVLEAVFDITVSDDAPIGGGDYEYFAHFMPEGSFSFRSRLDIVPATSGGDYTLGISTGGGTAESIFPSDFGYGVSVNVTLGFDFDTGLSSVTVGGTTITSTSAYLGETLDSFALRQSDSSNNETILVDNLLVSQIPEPSTLALIGLGGLAMAFRRRK